MKSIFDMKGAERAAALLVALGPAIASDILKHLDDESIEKITVEIAKIDRLSPADREELIGEFLIDLRKERRSIQGGESKAKELLIEAFGRDKAESILKKATPLDVENELGFLKEIGIDILVSFIKDEHPQTIAVILGCIDAGRSAELLKSLPPETAKEVAIKMAKMNKVSPEVVVGIAKTIKAKYKEYLQNDQKFKTVGGINSLVEILNYMSSDEEKKIMKNLDGFLPDISKQIREKIFIFDNIVNLTNMEARILIDELKDDRLIAKALKGAGDDIRFKVLRNMSQNRATDIINDMNAMGPIMLSEVEDCRNKIVSKIRELHENGVITIKRDNDIYVE